jgi:cytochrome c-type biogenesis protein CcmE
MAAMNPARKRQVRLVVALCAALLLASALMYTSFSAASPAVTPSQLLAAARSGRSYELTGTVTRGSVRRVGTTLDFAVQDRTGTGAAVPVVYTGEVPDPFREGREVIVTVTKQGSGFVGQRDSLVTKCPSKFTNSRRGQ